MSRAHEHIEQYGLGSYIETRRCDGLADIGHGEGDTLVIAGMGGPLMERILNDGRSVWDDFQEMIPSAAVRYSTFQAFSSGEWIPYHRRRDDP